MTEKNLTLNNIGDKYLNQVKTFGALGYSIGRILELLNLPDSEATELKLRISIPGDVYNKAYRQGCAIGEYNVDVELHKQAEKGDIDSIKLEEERNMVKKEDKLKRELFGV